MATSSIRANDIAQHLTGAHHTDATHGPAWRPGFRSTQASPRTVRLWHDGPDEQPHLDQYTATLKALGYHVTTERPRGQRPRLRITHP